MVPIISPSFTLSPIFTLRFISCPCDVATTSCISPPNNTPTTFNFVLILPKKDQPIPVLKAIAMVSKAIHPLGLVTLCDLVFLE